METLFDVVAILLLLFSLFGLTQMAMAETKKNGRNKDNHN